MHNSLGPLRGRGASHNPANRFETLRYERDPDALPGDDPAPATEFFKDRTCSIITTNDSPDVGFRYSINAYRGCEHGCAYCYARPSHEFLGMNAGLQTMGLADREEARTGQPSRLARFMGRFLGE